MQIASEVIVGQFSIVRFLQQTARSELYLAQHSTLGYWAVVKLARTVEFGSSIDHEVSILRRLRHPTNIQILDAGSLPIEGRNRPYLIVEHVDGPTLRELVRSVRRLSGQRVLSIARQILAGLEEAHTQGLVHGDIKPENVMLARGGGLRDQVKLIDYGVVGSPATSSGTGIRTKAVAWGTPGYISPEVARGAQPAPASDVFSVGVLMYEALAGRWPFEGDDPASLLAARFRSEAPRLDLVVPVAPDLADIIARALSVESNDRFQSAREFSDALVKCDRQQLRSYPMGSPRVGAEFVCETVELPALGDAPAVPQEASTRDPGQTVLRSTGRGRVWAMIGDPAMDRPELTAALEMIAESSDVQILDEHERSQMRGSLADGTVAPPSAVVFGDMHVLLDDALLRELADSGETMRILVSTHTNVELAQGTINAIGLDHQILLPALPREIADAVVVTLGRALSRRQHYDCLRLAVSDMAVDVAEVARGLAEAHEKQNRYE